MNRQIIKPILQKEDAFSAILPEQVALAQWMAKAYHCFLVDALRLMIPSQMRGGRVKEKTVEVVSVSQTQIWKRRWRN